MTYGPPGPNAPPRGPRLQTIIPEMRTQRPSNRRGTAPFFAEGQSSARHADKNGVKQIFTSNTALPPSTPRQHAGPILRKQEPWQTWPELTVKVTGLPPTITTWHLWKRFDREGTITLIEIFENRQGIRDGVAKIRFSPVPNQAFWDTPSFIIPTMDGQGHFLAKVVPEPRKIANFKLPSPVRKNIWYPQTMSLYPSHIGFGLMFDETTMMNMYEAQSLDRKETSFNVDLRYHRITTKFQLTYNSPQPDSQLQEPNAGPSRGPHEVQNYKFEIPFGQLKEIRRVVSENQWALIITLNSPPPFHRKRPIAYSHSEEMLLWTEFDTYLRQTDIIFDREHLKTSPAVLNKETATIDIGRWTTYRFLFDKARIDPGVFEEMRNALQDFNVQVIETENFSLIPGTAPVVWSLLDSHQTHDTSAQLRSLEEPQYQDFSLPFEVRYQLEACISNNVINEHNITPKCVQELAKIASRDLSGARRLLEGVLEDNTRIFHPSTLFEDERALESKIADLKSEVEIPDYCVLVRKVTITPTTMYLSSPTVETSNRIIRKFNPYSDRFLRVQFTDEKFEGRINACADKVRNDEIYTRVFRTLKNGIRIGGRHYEFLAFGNSQFRENGAYFFSPIEDMTCEKIRHWMGDFRHIKVVAKYAARLGQCFSTTRAIGGKVQIIAIEDVERNEHCFTDGVGKISQVLAMQIADQLRLSNDTVPSVFQFRMGGCKGILAVSPEVKGQQVFIRRSQSKFNAVYNGLEIIRWSRNAVATLNRQTITILSSLGVPDEVFNGMLLEQLSVYNQALTNKSLALEKLAQYIDENRTTVSIAKMILDGFMDTNEPFLASLLHLWRAWSIKMLKEKARIVVEKGAFLLGCTDETGSLRGHINDSIVPGDDVDPNRLPQIFVQVEDPQKRNHFMAVQGLCFVGRNPSLHPGDIRVVQAIDVPALHHLRNVVVFSQHGDRDVPSMCSGGDLDGDDFFVIWDPELRPREVNCLPMDYKAPKPLELDQLVEVHDIMKFFVRYMKNDALPKIAHAHLALSDYLEDGVKDPRCIELAHLHSRAVDYMKTGEPAVMPKRLHPRKWPHFMEKKKNEYISTKILGQLYDRVQRVDFVPKYDAPFDHRILNAYPTNNTILKTARQLKTQYDTAIRRVMAQQEIQTEFEIWSTFVLSKPRVGTDYKTQENLGVIGTALKDRFRTTCIEHAGAETSMDFVKMGPFVAAMYRVTHEEMEITLRECRTTIIVCGKQVPKRKMDQKFMPLISFPWLFPDILGRIATGVSDRRGIGDLNLTFLTNEVEPRTYHKALSTALDDDGVTETSDDIIIHRGEILDISWPDNVDSEGDDVEQAIHIPTTVDEVKNAELNEQQQHIKPADFDPLYDVSPQIKPRQRAMKSSPSSCREPSDLVLPPPANGIATQLPFDGRSMVDMAEPRRNCLDIPGKIKTSSDTSLHLSTSAETVSTSHTSSNEGDLQYMTSSVGQIQVSSCQTSGSRNPSSVHASSITDLVDLDFSPIGSGSVAMTPTESENERRLSLIQSVDHETSSGSRTSSFVSLNTFQNRSGNKKSNCTSTRLGSETCRSSLVDLKDREISNLAKEPTAVNQQVEEEEEEQVVLALPIETDLEKLSRLISKNDRLSTPGRHARLSSQEVGSKETNTEADNDTPPPASHMDIGNLDPFDQTQKSCFLYNSTEVARNSGHGKGLSKIDGMTSTVPVAGEEELEEMDGMYYDADSEVFEDAKEGY